ncbi:MAG: ammonia-forming cytochrome c nitrite reductase subunit c552 [Chloroflexi bacterium]|nr:ammonia-forming cytochrome c nitrite reductase subunit c552 [Chloroflexota bacterium]
MKQLWKLGAFLFILVLLIVLLPSTPTRAQVGTPPPIPHSLEGRNDCAICHATGVGGAPKFPADHTGRTNEMCQVCHKPGTARPPTTPPSGTPGAQPVTKPAAGTPPKIPHPLQNRDNCLACHQTGIGGSPKVPADHAGRIVETCKGCHQSATSKADVPVVVPTPVIHTSPVAKTQDACVTCHTTQAGKSTQVVNDWKSSIHGERNVTCADCHGGDATKADKAAAHSFNAGYIGIPKIVDIPALCASCHARVETMRQYDVPTDQWSKYQQSVHGQKLAQGDVKVATCATCHESHATKKSDDPTAKVYTLNVPALCASCHSNTEYMKGYNIPTNQYSLYIASVHGQALLNKQDLRSPTCATCHSTHGAAPPGFDEVANVCGSCHTATQQYYLQSVHANDKPGTPKCVTCHGRYDVMTPTDDMFIGNSTRQCGSCHPDGSPQAAAVKNLHDNITASAKALDDAEIALKRAAAAALITSPEEAKIAEAKTALITARAVQHTLNASLVKEKTDLAVAKANEVIANSEKASRDQGLRGQVMGVGLVIMAMAILSLYVIRRELYKQLPPE